MIRFNSFNNACQKMVNLLIKDCHFDSFPTLDSIHEQLFENHRIDKLVDAQELLKQREELADLFLSWGNGLKIADRNLYKLYEKEYEDYKSEYPEYNPPIYSEDEKKRLFAIGEKYEAQHQDGHNYNVIKTRFNSLLNCYEQN